MTFTALRTERLLIRPVRPTDAEAIVRRRNDPDVAEYQTWTPLYLDHGFEPTGEVHDGEVVGRLQLS